MRKYKSLLLIPLGALVLIFLFRQHKLDNTPKLPYEKLSTIKVDSITFHICINKLKDDSITTFILKNNKYEQVKTFNISSSKEDVIIGTIKEITKYNKFK